MCIKCIKDYLEAQSVAVSQHNEPSLLQNIFDGLLEGLTNFSVYLPWQESCPYPENRTKKAYRKGHKMEDEDT